MNSRCGALAIAFAVAGTPLPVLGETIIDYVVLRETIVRQGPDRSEREITTLLKGDTILSTGSFRERNIATGLPPVCEAGWCFVLANGHFGYVPQGIYKSVTTATKKGAF